MRQSSEPSDELKAPSPRGPHVVVGIGASAGGLDAIERFFDHVPSQSGLTFVVVQHLSPDFRSLMDELEEDPAELQALYQDLLVGVTQFFRDPDAFDILRSEVVPVICERSSDEEVRVWVPGCATGEEAYSLAILFREHMDRLKQPRDVRIFATDVHRPSLEIAANGRHRESAIKGLPAAHLRRYFSRRDDDFVVSKQIRQMVIFAPHNLTKDPPFTKLDLISCRNLLIYLNPQVQRKVLTLFHFGLSTGGVLLLGPSESLTELSDEFQVIGGASSIE